MSMRRVVVTTIVSGVIALQPLIAFAADGGAGKDNAEQVNHVLKQMSTALRELNYRGLFTYEVGGSLDTYKIVHRVDGDTEYERLQKLNGPEWEVLRAGHLIDCLSRGDRLLRGMLRSANSPSDLRDHYTFYLTGSERIADRIAMLVQVVPRDKHRFGYTLALDKQSGLPLQAMRVSTDKRVMERIQFIRLDVGGDIADEEVAPGSERHRRAAHDLIDCAPESTGADPAWQASWLPAGFVYSGERRIANGDHMLTYTDGLATFSIFISRPHSRPAIEGRAQIGATVAYVNQRIWSQQPHSVTVVGEIPFATAQRVVAGLEPR